MMVTSNQEKTTKDTMKHKILSIVAGAIALTVTATPFLVKAQSSSPSNQPGVESPKKHRGERGLRKDLNLTQDQKNRMKQIRTDTRAKIEAVLTDEQKKKLQDAKANRGQRQHGQRPQGQRREGGPFASLNLSEDQKAQIKQIMESSKQEMQSVLTPEQQQKVQDFKNAHPRRQPANP
jgi:protein CpxP